MVEKMAAESDSESVDWKDDPLVAETALLMAAKMVDLLGCLPAVKKAESSAAPMDIYLVELLAAHLVSISAVD